MYRVILLLSLLLSALPTEARDIAVGDWVQLRSQRGAEEEDGATTKQFAVVGPVAQVDGRQLAWLEMTVDNGYRFLTKLLVPLDVLARDDLSSDDIFAETRRFIYKQGDNPAVEWPPEEAITYLGGYFTFLSTPLTEADVVGEERVSVQAKGELACTKGQTQWQGTIGPNPATQELTLVCSSESVTWYTDEVPFTGWAQMESSSTCAIEDEDVPEGEWPLPFPQTLFRRTEVLDFGTGAISALVEEPTAVAPHTWGQVKKMESEAP